MEKTLPTKGQLERSLSQRIQAFYRDEFGHQPSKVTCQLFKAQLVIVMEDAVTPTEQLLTREGEEELAEQVRFSLDDATNPRLIELIESILGVKVTDLLSDSTLSTGRTGTIAILDAVPEVRNPEAI